MLKSFILLGTIISAFLFTNHANSEQSTGYIPYSPIVDDASDYDGMSSVKKRFGNQGKKTTGYIPYSPIVQCANNEIPIYRGSSIIKCISKEDTARRDVPDFGPNIRVIRRIPKSEYEGLINNHLSNQEFYSENENYINTYSNLKRDQIIVWFVAGFIVITLMSLPISLLWRFQLKTSACLFAIMTALFVIAIPLYAG